MQSQMDAERVIALGADAAKVRVIGNLKFDRFDEETNDEPEGFNTDDAEILIAGSTHPGEEEIIVNIYKRIRHDFPKLRVILAPRHIERVDEVLKLVEASGFKPILFSKGHLQDVDKNSIMIVDTIGQLRGLYKIATIVFIGKTLRVGGGQNMIEPAFYGKPIIVGPLTENFKDVMSIFLKDEAIIQVENDDDLENQIISLLRSQERMEDLGQKTKYVIQKYQGAVVKTLDQIEQLL